MICPVYNKNTTNNHNTLTTGQVCSCLSCSLSSRQKSAIMLLQPNSAIHTSSLPTVANQRETWCRSGQSQQHIWKPRTPLSQPETWWFCGPLKEHSLVSEGRFIWIWRICWNESGGKCLVTVCSHHSPRWLGRRAAWGAQTRACPAPISRADHRGPRNLERGVCQRAEGSRVGIFLRLGQVHVASADKNAVFHPGIPHTGCSTSAETKQGRLLSHILSVQIKFRHEAFHISGKIYVIINRSDETDCKQTN